MNQALAYLREILSAHTENDKLGRELYHKISKRDYTNVESFVRDLTQKESNYLDNILKESIDYSNQEQDYVRARQLNEVYELLTL